MSELQSELSRIMPRESELSTIDGVRLSAPAEWVLIRPSGTEPILRVTVEAKDRAEADSLMSQTISLAQHTIKKLST
jgi:phosphomannomutase